MNRPLVSVITPVYNVAAFIRPAIESVLKQTFGDFEFLLVDDCSTDESLEILNEYAAKDSRIRVLSTPVNSWAHAAGNVGLENAVGEYVAILDADDILPHDRFEQQLKAFEEDPGLGVCGGWMKLFGDLNKTIKSFQSEDLKIRMGMLFGSTMGHGTAMIRRSIIEDHAIRYNTDIYYAHDYDFFTQLAFDGGAKFTSIPHVLYFYRWHTGQTSVAKREEQIGYSDVVRKSVLNRFGISDTQTIDIHLHFSHKEPYKISASHEAILAYFESLVRHNKESGIFPDQPFRSYLASKLCYDMHRCGIPGLRFYLSFPHKNDLGWSVFRTIHFMLKCLRPVRRQPSFCVDE